MLNELKALNLHTGRDSTQEHLLGIYINVIDDETFELVATDGHSLLKKTYLTEDWHTLRMGVRNETDFLLPETPTNGFLRISDKIREKTSDKKVFLPLSEADYEYPDYQEICPDLTNSEPLTDLELFSFLMMDRIKKTYRILGLKYNEFIRILTMPNRKPYSAVYQLLTGGWYMLIMPIRPVEDPENKITK